MVSVAECPASVNIGDASYAVDRRGPRTIVLTADNGGQSYTVIQGPDRPTCTCPSFIHREAGKKDGKCKHVQACIDEGLISPPAGPPEVFGDGEGLTLEGIVRREADRFAAWGNGAGDLMAERLRGLADDIRFTSASTADEFIARLETMEPEYPTTPAPRRRR